MFVIDFLQTKQIEKLVQLLTDDRSKVRRDTHWSLSSFFPVLFLPPPPPLFPLTPLTPSHQIKALIQCGRLKNAYLIAIKSRLIDEVRNISQIAEKAGQLAVRDICDKWLLSNSISHQ